MDKVVFKGQQISNWLDYILVKFADQNYYEIENKAAQDYIVINSLTNKTKIWFYGLGETGLLLADCQYSSDDCNGWSGETCAVDSSKYGTFTQDNLNTIDEILNTPIYNGWISVDYYLGASFYKALMYADKDKAQPPFTYFGSKFGCVSIILFPIFILINILLRNGLIGSKTEITIEPIIEKPNDI
ncbi:MAG: hypothetical protein WBM13_15200 [Bacteroidia bacterium]